MNELEKQISALVNEEFGVKVDVILTRPDPEFGDFATNIALQISKQLDQNPKELAEILKTKIQSKLIKQISEVNVAGPGFINLRLNEKLILNDLELAEQITKTMIGKEVVAEYSDPNPFKELHAGHLYTTLVGDAISRLLESAGANVHRINYGGDVGLHAGKAMWAIIKFLGGEKSEELNKVPEGERPKWLSERYVEGSTTYETDEKAKDEIVQCNKRVYELHANNDHQSDFAKIYWECRQWSYQGFDRLYEQLQVTPFERVLPESEVTPTGIEMVNKGLADGVFEKSDGAIVYKGEVQGLHTRVFINSEGLPTYEAKDLGLAATKWQDYHFDKNFIITGNDIVEYMKVVLAALSNYYPEVAQRTKHLTHGMIKLPGGVKMSSRKGNVLRAMDILEAATEAAKKVTDMADNQTVLAAVKYGFLKSRIGGDIIYDPAESVSTEGNSGPYLQYAHARAFSILTKSESKILTPSDLDPAERQLVVKITEFSDVVTKATVELAPHLICTYLYELAQEFNRFYEKNRVIGDSRESTRLYIIQKYSQVLNIGLGLLGIHAPEKM